MPWTEADTDAYWLAVAREAKGDERKALACADPWTMVIRSDSDALRPASFAEPDPEYQRVWRACLEWLTPTDQQSLELGYASGSGGLPIGRAGGGVSISRELGIHQSTWVSRLQLAEGRLTSLASIVRAGHTVQAVCRRVDQEPLRGALVAHSALVRAYAQTWSTKGAAALLGMSQSAAHTRLTRLAKTEPIIEVIKATRKIG